jgi:hypothetical protein
VSSISFRGYQAGQVIFHGMQAQLSTQNPDFVTASFEFEAGPNRRVANDNPITIDNITNIEKNAWDWLDVHYAPQVPTGITAVVPVAQYVLVHRVYDSSDFTGLNIGTGEMLPLWQG